MNVRHGVAEDLHVEMCGLVAGLDRLGHDARVGPEPCDLADGHGLQVRHMAFAEDHDGVAGRRRRSLEVPIGRGTFEKPDAGVRRSSLPGVPLLGH